MSHRSTLADPLGTVHRVTVPAIPAEYPGGGGVTIVADCGAGSDLPAHLARRTTHPAFTGRIVTCPACRWVADGSVGPRPTAWAPTASVELNRP